MSLKKLKIKILKTQKAQRFNKIIEKLKMPYKTQIYSIFGIFGPNNELFVKIVKKNFDSKFIQ
jgi:hypothetical protein